MLTHHRDFAQGFGGLLGNDRAIGHAFHITSDELLTWNQIHHMLAAAAGTTVRIVHVPSTRIARYGAQWADSLLGDKVHSMIFDNMEIRQVVPEYRAIVAYSRGAEEIMAWYVADPARRVVDAEVDPLMDRIISECGSAARPRAWVTCQGEGLGR